MSKTYVPLHPDEKVYIMLDDLNLDSRESELKKFVEMWNAGLHIEDIASVLMREEDEIGLMIVDQKRKGKIEERRRGMFGG